MTMEKDTFRQVLEHEIEDAQSWLAGGIRPVRSPPAIICAAETLSDRRRPRLRDKRKLAMTAMTTPARSATSPALVAARTFTSALAEAASAPARLILDRKSVV